MPEEFRSRYWSPSHIFYIHTEIKKIPFSIGVIQIPAKNRDFGLYQISAEGRNKVLKIRNKKYRFSFAMYDKIKMTTFELCTNEVYRKKFNQPVAI